MRWAQVVAAVAGWALASLGTAAEIRLVGSDLVRVSLERIEGRFEKATGSGLTADLRGTQPGLEALRAGQADLALVLLTPKATADLTGLRRYPLGYVAPIFLVQRDNPVEQVTAADLAGVFGAEETAQFNRWGDLRATGPMASRTINLRVIAPRASLVVDYFRTQHLSRPALRASVIYDDSFEALVRAVESDPSAIGLSALPPPPSAGVKTLAIAESAGEAAFPPSLENLHIGDYRWRLPLEIAFPADQRATVAPFIIALLSEDSFQDLALAGIIGLPADVRRQIVAELSK